MNLVQLHPGLLQLARRRPGRVGDAWVQVVAHVLDDNAHAQPTHALCKRGAVVGRRVGQAARVERIVAGDGAQQDRRIGDRARQRANMVERSRERADAMQTHAPVGRLQAHHAAVGGRDADRATGVGADRAPAHAGRHRRRRAAARPAAGARDIPGVVALAIVWMHDPIGELQQVALADQHRPGLLQAAGDGGGCGGHPVAPDTRGGGRACAGGVDQILERDRHAVQRAAVDSLEELDLGLARLLQRRPLQHRDKAIEAPIQPADAIEDGARRLDGREGMRAVAPAERGDIRVAQLLIIHVRRLRRAPRAGPRPATA